MSHSPPRILYLVTHPMTVDVLLRGQLAFLRGRGFEVAAACADDERLARIGAREGVPVHPLPLEREISPLRDLRALTAVVSLLRRLRPHLLHASTPKAAFLGLLAGRIVGIPHRVFLLRGLRSETLDGWRSRIQRLTERACARLATRCVANGPSLARRARELGVAAGREFRVLGHGSSNGVDGDRFRFRPEAGDRLRRRLGIPAGEAVVGFVGRLTRDKGVEDLLEAAESMGSGSGEAPRLVLVGAAEAGDPLSDSARGRIARSPRVHHVDWVDDTAPWYSLFDVVAFPSYREGLPNVPLEAGCCERPVVGYSATGTVDVVRSGVTGELVSPGDVKALADALGRYLDDPELRREHGVRARSHVLERFSRERVWRLWADFYRDLLGAPQDDGSGPATAGAGS